MSLVSDILLVSLDDSIQHLMTAFHSAHRLDDSIPQCSKHLMTPFNTAHNT